MVGYGVNYTTGRAIHEGTQKEGMEPPRLRVGAVDRRVGDDLLHRRPLPGWKGDMLVGGMSGQRLMRLRAEGQKVVERRNR